MGCMKKDYTCYELLEIKSVFCIFKFDGDSNNVNNVNNFVVLKELDFEIETVCVDIGNHARGISISNMGTFDFEKKCLISL